MITLYLIRHGQTEANREKCLTGQLNSPLTLRGRAEAQALAEVLHDTPISAIYTSTLSRTVETALPTSRDHGIPIRPEAGLMEMHLGILQGQCRRAFDDFHRRIWETYKAQRRTFRIPGGETFEDMAHRVRACLRRILSEHADGDTLLVVGHRNTNRVLLADLMNWPGSHWLDLDIRSRFLYRVVRSNPPHLSTINLDGAHRGVRCEGFQC